MTEKAQFEKPDFNEDRLRPGKILLIGVLGFAVGFFVVWLREGGRRVPLAPHSEGAEMVAPARAHEDAPEPEAPTPTPSEEPTNAMVANGETTDEGDTATPATETGATPGAPTTPGTPSASPTEPVGPPPAVGTQLGTFERGRIAYLRCDGAPGGDEHCPRDEAMEDAVWHVLETLPRCANPPRGLGEADIRLEFRRNRSTEVSMRARAEDTTPHLDGERILDCVAGQLSHVETSIRADRVVASFRFEMR